MIKNQNQGYFFFFFGGGGGGLRLGGERGQGTDTEQGDGWTGESEQ